MKYFKVNIYPDGTVVKEEIIEEETRGYLGNGIYFCGSKEGNYNFFIESEHRVQKVYDKYIKSKIRGYKKDVKRIQNTIKNLEKLPTVI